MLIVVMAVLVTRVGFGAAGGMAMLAAAGVLALVCEYVDSSLGMGYGTTLTPLLLAMGFLGPERRGPIAELGLRLTERGTVWRDERWMTSVPGVFACGDMQRGQSLIVWAIAEGRSCARGVDLYLLGASELPAPL